MTEVIDYEKFTTAESKAQEATKPLHDYPEEIDAGLSVLMGLAKGSRITRHPSREGWVVIHPEYAARWVHCNGAVEILNPLPTMGS